MVRVQSGRLLQSVLHPLEERVENRSLHVDDYSMVFFSFHMEHSDLLTGIGPNIGCFVAGMVGR